MENSSIDSAIEPVGAESKIPLILAIAAFVLGGLSFVLAWNVRSNLSRYKETVQKDVAEAAEKAAQAAADARAATGGAGIDAASKTDVEELKAQLQQLHAEYQKNFREIANSQKQVVDFSKTVKGRLDRLENGRGASSGSGAGTQTANRGGQTVPPAATPASAAGKYVVQKGDYPATIAKKHGISLNEFMKANPGINPNKLQIGQTVNIPEKK